MTVPRGGPTLGVWAVNGRGEEQGSNGERGVATRHEGSARVSVPFVYVIAPQALTTLPCPVRLPATRYPATRYPLPATRYPPPAHARPNNRLTCARCR